MGVEKWLMVREIRERVDYPPVAYTTIATMTSILCRKGLAHRELTERAGLPGLPAWQYRAARPASEHIGELIAALPRSPSPGETLAHALATARCVSNAQSTPPTSRSVAMTCDRHRNAGCNAPLLPSCLVWCMALLLPVMAWHPLRDGLPGRTPTTPNGC
ncbi:MAG TPA: hypothetical protein VIV12_21620 [Streptosporangiaceae bacterium]